MAVITIAAAQLIRSEEALDYPSLIATEELTELVKPGSIVPLYKSFRCD
jgi:hypothetical protein